MISIGLAILLAILYANGAYALAFWLSMGVIVNGLLGVAKAIAKPEWYLQKRLEAGLDLTYDLKGLIATKVLLIVPFLVVVLYFGRQAGYF